MRDNPKSFHQATGHDVQFVQDNHSRSGKGVLRVVRGAGCGGHPHKLAHFRETGGGGTHGTQSPPVIVLTTFISPFRADRQTARSLFSEGEFVENSVDAPHEIAEAHDPKELYKRARRGELKPFTGIDSPCEPPLAPDIRLDTTVASPNDIAELVMRYLHSKGFVVLEQQYKAVSSWLQRKGLPSYHRRNWRRLRSGKEAVFENLAFAHKYIYSRTEVH